jgi:hypothetical protein
MASFTGAKFFGEATLAYAIFFKVVSFDAAAFYRKTYFMLATFSGQMEASLEPNSVTFSEKTVTYFMLAKFSGNTNFTLTKFSGQATSFRQATFSGGVNFNLAMFSGQAGFETTTFSGQANLSKANFKRITYFSGATFQKEADFNQAAFFHRVYFSDRSPDLGTFNGVTRFNYVLFEANEKIIFDVHDLSKVSFANTDITRIRFSEIARWGEGKKDKDRFKIIEERWLEESRENLINLEGAMAVYRDLRENYEFRLRYDEAGKFFTREMELKRNYREVLSQDGSSTIVKSNDLLRRNLSLTGKHS